MDHSHGAGDLLTHRMFAEARPYYGSGLTNPTGARVTFVATLSLLTGKQRAPHIVMYHVFIPATKFGLTASRVLAAHLLALVLAIRYKMEEDPSAIELPGSMMLHNREILFYMGLCMGQSALLTSNKIRQMTDILVRYVDVEAHDTDRIMADARSLLQAFPWGAAAVDSLATQQPQQSSPTCVISAHMDVSIHATRALTAAGMMPALGRVSDVKFMVASVTVADVTLVAADSDARKPPQHAAVDLQLLPHSRPTLSARAASICITNLFDTILSVVRSDKVTAHQPVVDPAMAVAADMVALATVAVDDVRDARGSPGDHNKTAKRKADADNAQGGCDASSNDMPPAKRGKTDGGDYVKLSP